MSTDNEARSEIAEIENIDQSGQPAEQVSPVTETRARTLTEKGKEYQISVLENNFKTALSLWRRASSKTSILLSDCQDVDILRRHRRSLEDALDQFRFEYNRLQVLKADISIEYDKFDQVEIEHQHIMQRISECIREIENQKYEVRSYSSSRTSRSKSSRSSVKSGISKISDIAVRKAALKAELKFIDIESKAKAELLKIETLKKLEIAGAEQAALEEALDQSISESEYDINISASLLNEGKTEYARSYVETHAKLLNETDTLTPALDQGISFAASQSGAHVTSSSHSLPVQSPLNPLVSSFDPSSVQAQSSRTHNGARPVVSFAAMPAASNGIDSSVNTAAHNSPISSSMISTPVQGGISRAFGDKTTDVTGTIISGSSNQTEQGLIDLAKTLAQQLNLSRLPPPEPSVFSGDPLTYPGWRSAFQILIEERQIPQSEKIHYLKRYLSGNVRDAIEGYFLLSSDQAYEEAKKMLDTRYGDPFVISNAFREKLDRWPNISPRDGTGLRRFSDFLQQCQIAMKTIGSLGVLNDDRENRKLLMKLPDWVVSRWGRVVVRRKEERSEFPPFSEFVVFVTKEATIACDPVTSIQSLKEVGDNQRHVSEYRDTQRHVKFSDRQHKTFHGSRTFLTEVEAKDKNESASARPKVPCVLCNRPHDVDDCREFLNKTLMERKVFIKEKGLCFACLKRAHIAKECKHRKKCKICSKSNPSSLHGDIKGPNQNERNSNSSMSHKSGETALKTTVASHTGAVSSRNLDRCKKFSMIVPVFVSHCDNPDKERLVYALLDTQSDTTFILEDTCKALDVTGVEVKLSLSTMYATDKVVTSSKVQGLMVRGVENEHIISLPSTFTRNIMPANHDHIPSSDIARTLPHLESIADQIGTRKDCEIGLLIGYNCPRALVPREVIVSNEDGHYALRTDLGWSIVGIVDADSCDDDNIGLSHRILAREVDASLSGGEDTTPSVLFSLKTKVKEIVADDVLRVMESDFSDHGVNDAKYSQEDLRFISVLSQGIRFENGHYEMPLPFKGKNPCLPNNRSYALNRLKSLQRKLVRDQTYQEHYVQFINDLLKNNHAEIVPESEINATEGFVWYIPHHGVYHPQKPDKIRVVFDCSAQFHGQSLNAHLLQGPDLTNNLLGVLCRFRREPIALTCDVEKMFHQFKVNPSHRDYLRFLWWSDDDYSKDPQEYRMNVHLFGATSSPGCANFGFRKIAEDNQDEFGEEAADFIRRDFYVDDGLKSVSSVDEATSLIKNTQSMCTKGGLRLHKFVSNDKDVLQYMNPEKRAKDLKDINLALDQLPVERTLGILWSISSDTFQFKVALKDSPLTRRGILSTVSSMYDPMGFISPVILKGKQILQEMCADNMDWDDPLPDKLRARWDHWRSGLKDLTMIDIQRCIKPKDFGDVKSAEMHHFSDASTSGYGQCSYLRLVNESNQVHCSLLMGKARVIPLRPITVPRLELTAALLSVKVGSCLDRELNFPGLSVSHVFWTDSKVVLGYLANEARRFHVFVANRVQQIRDRTQPSRWRYVSSGLNLADIASRGASAKDLNESKWFRGPDFLWESELPGQEGVNSEMSPDDPEVKRSQCFSSQSEHNPSSSILERILYFSDWHRAKRAVAVCLRFIDKLRNKIVKKPAKVESLDCLRLKCLPEYQPVTVSELQRAEVEILKCVQLNDFKHEIKYLIGNEITGVPSTRKEQLFRHRTLNGKSRLHKLDPFLDPNGLLRVGGRIQNANLSDLVKHPIVLPPPGNFQRPDIYSRKRWRRVQYLINQFWFRWRSEYIQNLQVREKWNSPRRNLAVGDVVLLKDDNQPRNQWQLCRIVDVQTDEDGCVRKAKIAIGQSSLDSKGKRKTSVVHLERPIHKLVLLKETEVIPVEEPL